MEDKLGVIYKITNMVNGKAYIGQTVDFQRRKRNHLNATTKYSIHKAFDKYGIENFEWSIIEDNIPKDKLDEREIYWIDYYDTYNNGYNETRGGDNAESLVNWIKNNPEEVLNNARNGLKYAEEYWKQHPGKREKQIREAQKQGVRAVMRKVRCIELDLVFESLAEAERWSQSSANPNGKKASHQHIAHVCKGDRHTCGGYHWEYVDKNNN